MDQVRAELAQKATAVREAGEDTEGRLAHLQVDDRERGGPLLGDGWAQNQESDGMATLRHAAGQCQHQPFSSAHAERSEHVDNPHSAQIPQTDFVER